MLRRALGSVCFLLVSLADTVPRALAIEALLIKTVAPEANIADQAFDQKQRDVHPRFSPTPRKKASSATPAFPQPREAFPECVWELPVTQEGLEKTTSWCKGGSR